MPSQCTLKHKSHTVSCISISWYSHKKFRAALFEIIKMKTIQMSINNRMDKYIVKYSFNKGLYSNKNIQRHDTIWMNLRSTMWSERSKSWKIHTQYNFIYIKFKTKLFSLGKHPSAVVPKKRNENIITNIRESAFLWVRGS